ncbi:hypothetical protein HRbin21_00141 [bacterium HR21]|nr:hypothetical protein HRbin21_00141 [bacterium HR21]
MHAEFPRLQLLALEEVLFHEEVGAERVERLRAQLMQSGLLRNPPIAAPLEHGRFVLLDGATRVTALQRLGCSAIVAQLVDYPGAGVELRTWSHFLPQWELEEFEEHIRRLGFRPHRCSAAQARHALANRAFVAAATMDGEQMLALQPPEGLSVASSLRRLVHAYASTGTFQRVSEEEIALLRHQAAQLPGVLVVFPSFTPLEIRQLALSGERLPAGITRHIIAGRLLQVNIPLAELLSPTSMEEKTQWLQQWWHERLRHHRMRYYPEPTFVLEE